MVVNGGVEYGAAEQRYQDAKSNEEKLLALMEMLRTVPKHKGTENIRVELNKKVAKLKSEVEKQKLSVPKKGGGGSSMTVKKEGAGQVCLLGLPNAGKSWLFNRLTGLFVLEAPFAFSTTLPEKGMMKFENIQIQLVELPAIVEGSTLGKANGTQVLSLARNADALIIVVNALDAINELKIIGAELKEAKILVNRSKPNIRIKHSDFAGIHLSGKEHLQMPPEDFESFLQTIGYANADVLLEESTTKEKVLQVLDESIRYIPAFFVLCRNDFSQLAAIQSAVGVQNVVVVADEAQAKGIQKNIFLLLHKIRVYTKKPGHEADQKDPLVLPENSTVEDAAKTLHKDFSSLKSARVWGSSKMEGQRVGKDYILKDSDIVEISV